MMWLSVLISLCVAGAPAKSAPKADWNYTEKKMVKAGFKRDFINSVKSTYEARDFKQTVELNLLLFLKKSNYHGPQVNAAAASDVRRFMANNATVLERAERDHGVSKGVIASLLWIESRHGKVQGDFHVPSVYAHLLQIDRKDVAQYLQFNARYFTDDPISSRIRKKIKERIKTKSDWAMQELKALEKMHRRDKNLVRQLKGSFAGAFGMSQFIPSSYVHWARPYKKSDVPNLMKSQDAIYSVANYLRDNGWKRKKPKTHMKALLKYNNSEDYANAILDLSRKATMPINTPLRRVSTSEVQ